MSEAQKQTDVPSEYLLDLTAGPDNPGDGTQPGQTQGQDQSQQNPEDSLPEKYRGKTAAEIAEMHRNLESELGRARNEIGQVRRLADELLGINRAQAARTEAVNPPQRKPLTPDDLLSNPEQAVTSVVKAEADAREHANADRLSRLEQELVLARFERKHPEYRTTMEDPKFVEWVQKSSLRGRLAQSAAGGDYAAADELFTLYSEAQTVTQSTQRSSTDQARAAGLARPGGSTTATAGAPQSGNKQIWSRAKLMEMRLNNPEEFERLQPEILRAYAEKRVK